MKTYDILYSGKRIGVVLAESRYHAVDKWSNEHPECERRYVRAVERRYYAKGGY